MRGDCRRSGPSGWCVTAHGGQLAHGATIDNWTRVAHIVQQMSRTIGIECKKQEVYVALAEDGALLDVEPQRLQVPAIHEQSARLRGFLDAFGRVLAELQPDSVNILQPETVYSASYGEIAPKAALETLIRLACVDVGVPVQMLHRATVRSSLGGKGKLDELIAEKIEPVGKYWNAGRKYAAAAALTTKRKK
ncbi:MAG TPA: hypothetical protein VFJ77_03860 [Gaiellaceae bacterium]|nr:hypothetical protein [Gaiellaceae bacterium]